MFRVTALMLMAGSLFALLATLLVTSDPAEAGCTRVYTTSGWVTRCK